MDVPREVSGRVDWQDLNAKLQAVTTFVAKVVASPQGHGDSFFTFVEYRQADEPCKPVELMWMSPGLGPAKSRTRPPQGREALSVPEGEVADPRDHESLLRRHFAHYDIVLRKEPGSWSCILRSRRPPLPRGPSSTAPDLSPRRRRRFVVWPNSF